MTDHLGYEKGNPAALTPDEQTQLRGWAASRTLPHRRHLP